MNVSRRSLRIHTLIVSLVASFAIARGAVAEDCAAPPAVRPITELGCMEPRPVSYEGRQTPATFAGKDGKTYYAVGFSTRCVLRPARAISPADYLGGGELWERLRTNVLKCRYESRPASGLPRPAQQIRDCENRPICVQDRIEISSDGQTEEFTLDSATDFRELYTPGMIGRAFTGLFGSVMRIDRAKTVAQFHFLFKGKYVKSPGRHEIAIEATKPDGIIHVKGNPLFDALRKVKVTMVATPSAGDSEHYIVEIGSSSLFEKGRIFKEDSVRDGALGEFTRKVSDAVQALLRP
jgi:hypothetical protein